MNGDTLVVLMGNDVAGTLTRPPDGRLRFDYDPAYRAQVDPIPLSVSMPVQVATHPDREITPWLWGLLPESEAVITRWAREFQVSASSPFFLLGSPVGNDCPGRVRFCPPADLDEARSRAGTVQWLTEDEVATRLRELRIDATAWLGTTMTGQFSLAGAQSKTALLHEDGRWGVPSGRTATSHILKPPIPGFADQHLNEHLCLTAAEKAGLEVASSRVMWFAGESAIVVTRYDRVPGEGGLERIHQEDFAQALGRRPTDKYQKDGGPSPSEIVNLFRRVMPGRVADDATRRFVDALAWNWIIAGTDAHAKNYSLLLRGHDVELAPLYDVASFLPYSNDPLELHLAMKVGGEYRLKAHRRQNWEKTATELRLDPEEVCARVLRLAEQAPDAFRDAAATPDVAELKSELPRRLVDAVAARAQSCAALL